MAMIKTVVIDIDATFIDTHKALSSIIKDEYGKYFHIQDVLTYDFNKSLVNDFPRHKLIPMLGLRIADLMYKDYGLPVSREVILSILNRCEIYDYATPFENTVELLKQLMISENYSVVFFSLSGNMESAEAKRVLLDKYFSGYSYEYEYVIGKTKGTYSGDADIVIDDNISDLEGYGSSVEKVLVDKPYNQEVYNPNKRFILQECKRVKSLESYLLSLLKLEVR